MLRAWDGVEVHADAVKAEQRAAGECCEGCKLGWRALLDAKHFAWSAAQTGWGWGAR